MDEVLEQPGIFASPRPMSVQDPSHPKIPVNPRSQSTQDPSQPKIPVNPRSQSAQDPSRPKIPAIWFMRNPYQLNFPIPTWVSVILIWHMQIFLSLKNT